MPDRGRTRRGGRAAAGKAGAAHLKDNGGYRMRLTSAAGLAID